MSVHALPRSPRPQADVSAFVPDWSRWPLVQAMRLGVVVGEGPDAASPWLAFTASPDDHALREAVARALGTRPGARLACVTVISSSQTSASDEDKSETNVHRRYLTTLRQWAQPLDHPGHQTSCHVLESSDVAQALLDEDIHAIYSSDLQRAHHTAQAIAQAPQPGGHAPVGAGAARLRR